MIRKLRRSQLRRLPRDRHLNHLLEHLGRSCEQAVRQLAMIVAHDPSLAPVDVGVLRELQGVMSCFGADQGLIVSWGGFKESVLREARQQYFRMRLWDSGDVIAALAEHYDRLPDAMQAEIPMKQIWTLVVEE